MKKFQCIVMSLMEVDIQWKWSTLSMDHLSLMFSQGHVHVGFGILPEFLAATHVQQYDKCGETQQIMFINLIKNMNLLKHITIIFNQYLDQQSGHNRREFVYYLRYLEDKREDREDDA
ncbi:hypothetical protein QQ045_030481 [Rhodiola kirilowii]